MTSRQTEGVTSRQTEGVTSRQTLLLSVDFEDWHQLVRRRIGAENWRQAGPALERQTAVLLNLLEGLGVRATFFILGMAARAHPQLVEAVAAARHEIGCHGDAHRPVHSQRPSEFVADLRRSRGAIESITGQRPVGFRAPAFSITAESRWAFDVLADEGFLYDSSHHDTPRIHGRAPLRSSGPEAIRVASGAKLWEFPIAVWRGRYGRVPVGGASYWALMPTGAVLSGLARGDEYGGLYLHPQELDPQRLRVGLPPNASPAQRAHAALRTAQRNVARRRAPGVLSSIAERFQLIPYGEAYARLDAGAGARPQPVPG